jgi:hypothetical protein
MASDIVNGFLGATYGAYIGTLVADNYLEGNYMFSVVLFCVIFVNLMGTLHALHQEELSAFSTVLAIWALAYMIYLAYPNVASRVFLGSLIGTLWILLFLPHVRNRWIEGRVG